MQKFVKLFYTTYVQILKQDDRNDLSKIKVYETILILYTVSATKRLAIKATTEVYCGKFRAILHLFGGQSTLRGKPSRSFRPLCARTKRMWIHRIYY